MAEPRVSDDARERLFVAIGLSQAQFANPDGEGLDSAALIKAIDDYTAAVTSARIAELEAENAWLLTVRDRIRRNPEQARYIIAQVPPSMPTGREAENARLRAWLTAIADGNWYAMGSTQYPADMARLALDGEPAPAMPTGREVSS